MKVSQHPDMIASHLPLRLSVQSGVAALGTLAILGARLLRTSKVFQRQKKGNRQNF
jgi:hypothetical protein